MEVSVLAQKRGLLTSQADVGRDEESNTGSPVLSKNKKGRTGEGPQHLLTVVGDHIDRDE